MFVDKHYKRNKIDGRIAFHIEDICHLKRKRTRIEEFFRDQSIRRNLVQSIDYNANIVEQIVQLNKFDRRIVRSHTQRFDRSMAHHISNN